MQRPPSAIIHGHMYTRVIGNCLRHVGLAMTCGRCEWTWCNNRNVNIAIYRSARCTNHSPAWWATVHHRERKCADTTGIVPVPWAGHFLCQNINLFFANKIYGSNLSNNTRQLLWFEITPKCWLLFKKKVLLSFITILGTVSCPAGHAVFAVSEMCRNWSYTVGFAITRRCWQFLDWEDNSLMPYL